LGRVALLGIIGFVHLGHAGAAAANISGYDRICRIFLVELPIPTISSLFCRRTILPAACRRRGDKVPVRSAYAPFLVTSPRFEKENRGPNRIFLLY
jgi:hypothetical protein